MLLTVALMPAARMSCTHWSICACGSCVNSLWSMAMSVSRPAESAARRAPGTTASIWASTCCIRTKLALRTAAPCWYIFDSCRRLLGKDSEPIWPLFSPAGSSATAPFSATMASTGQAWAKGTLQPTGRPVTGMTCRPAARSAANACTTCAGTSPSVLKVSSMSVSTPSSCPGAGTDQSLSGRKNASMAGAVSGWCPAQAPHARAADGNESSENALVPAERRRARCTGTPACWPRRAPGASGRRR